MSADEHLFKKMLAGPDHILQVLLPPPDVQNNNLRKKQHNRLVLDNFQTAYHTWLIAVLLQDCYIIMYIKRLSLILL